MTRSSIFCSPQTLTLLFIGTPWSPTGSRGYCCPEVGVCVCVLLTDIQHACAHTDKSLSGLKRMASFLQAPGVAPTRIRQAAQELSAGRGSHKCSRTEKCQLLWKRLVKSANQEGVSNSQSAISTVLLRIFPLLTRALCLAAAYILRQAANRKSRHTSLNRRPAEKRLNIIAGFHGNKRVGRQLRVSELAGVSLYPV